MKIRTCIILFLVTVVQYRAAAQTVSASVDKQKILIGEPLRLNIKITAPQNSPAKRLTIDSILHFEILSKATPDSTQEGNNIQWEQVYTITSWDSGRWQLPNFRLPGAVVKRTKPLIIEVAFAPFDTTKDYNDVKDILGVAPPPRTTWYWYVIGAALLIGLFLLLFSPQKKKVPVTAAPDIGAYKEALQALEKLKTESPNLEVKIFYTRLIEVFRTYLQRSKGIQSHSKTTEDLAQQIKTLGLSSESYNSLVQTLQLSDFVKFAQFQPAAAENNGAFDNIKQSIITIENLK